MIHNSKKIGYVRQNKPCGITWANSWVANIRVIVVPIIHVASKAKAGRAIVKFKLSDRELIRRVSCTVMKYTDNPFNTISRENNCVGIVWHLFGFKGCVVKMYIGLSLHRLFILAFTLLLLPVILRLFLAKLSLSCYSSINSIFV